MRLREILKSMTILISLCTYFVSVFWAGHFLCRCISVESQYPDLPPLLSGSLSEFLAVAVRAFGVRSIGIFCMYFAGAVMSMFDVSIDQGSVFSI
ncbi:hypothetical protein V1509DRAFT_614617 [Lipomyces kononenkoae]